jgi:ribosome-associated protein
MPPDDVLAITPEVTVRLDEIQLRASRSSGPGGQHANVTASRIEAVFDVAGSRSLTDQQKRRIIARAGPRVTAVAQEARGQARNRELALARLRDRLAAALAEPKRRRATRPTRAAAERRLAEKRARSRRKRERRRPEPDDAG